MRLRNVCKWWWCWAVVLGVSDAVRPVCDHSPQRCTFLGAGHDEYNYLVDGAEHIIKFTDGGYFSLECSMNVTLDNEALPQFREVVRVAHVYLINCPPPNNAYLDVLQRLKVVALNDLTIRRAHGIVSAVHLAGLTVTSLALENLRLAPDAFDKYNATQLRLDSVDLLAIENLPASLQYLHVVEIGIRNLTNADFLKLPSLIKLTVREEGPITIEAAGNVSELALQANSVFLNPALPDNVHTVTVIGWTQPTLVPWKSCKGLKVLVIEGEGDSALPEDWVKNCEKLTNVTIRNCGLEKLPNGLLDNVKSLTYLNLSENRLKELPSGLFGKTTQLQVLDLSYNKLTSATFDKLASVTSLHELSLSGNARLGDACPTSNGVSKLQDLKRLRRLLLSETGARYICRDYRENMSALSELELANNNITELTFSDLRFPGPVRVELGGNAVTSLLYTHREYRLLLQHRARYCAAPPRAALALSAALACDCRHVWAALALRACPAHLPPALALRCAAGGTLAGPLARDLDEFVCALPPERCPAPPPCRCAERRRDLPGGGEQRVLRVSCEGAALRAPPALPPARGATWQLLLRNTSLRSVRAADLPSHLATLDLRDNALSLLPPEVVRAVEPGGRLLLPDGALSCACDNRAGLAALLARPDLEPRALRCADGAPLHEPRCAGLGAAGLAAGLAALTALAALGAGCAVRRGAGARLKAALRARGLLAPEREAEDEGLPYDVFVSFAHGDAEVAAALLAGLEPRYRVCVHWRDWAPGAWIPAQIAASVRGSRRTLALVSARSLRSSWARAELREAAALALRERRPRLVAVLLEEPARLELDDELRRYLETTTYVRWGDAWFWRKLHAALPPPRAPAPPGAPALPPVLPVEGPEPRQTGAAA